MARRAIESYDLQYLQNHRIHGGGFFSNLLRLFRPVGSTFLDTASNLLTNKAIPLARPLISSATRAIPFPFVGDIANSMAQTGLSRVQHAIPHFRERIRARYGVGIKSRRTRRRTPKRTPKRKGGRIVRRHVKRRRIKVRGVRRRGGRVSHRKKNKIDIALRRALRL